MKCYIRHAEESSGIRIDDCPLEGIEDRIKELKRCGHLRDLDNELDVDDYCFQVVRSGGEVFIEIIYGMEE